MYSVSVGVWNGVRQLLQRLDANITSSLASLRKELNCSPWPYPTLPSTWAIPFVTVYLDPTLWCCLPGSLLDPVDYLGPTLSYCKPGPWSYPFVKFDSTILGATLYWLEAQGLHYGKRDLSNSSSSLWFMGTCCLPLSPGVLVTLESLLRLL